jgi:hypothetical protein
MNIFYLDVSGGRKWKDFRSSNDLLETEIVPTPSDIAFLHVTDVLRGAAENARGIPEGKKQALFDTVKGFKMRPIGNGRTAIVFVSGAPPSDDAKLVLYKTLGDHDQSRVQFFPAEIPHGLGADELEKRLGSLIDKCSKDLDIRAESLEAEWELNTIFRLFWQTYVLANTNAADTPDALKRLKVRIGNCAFGEDYWKPLLNEKGRLDERLVRIAEKELHDVFIALRDETNWDHLSANTIVNQYREKWFATLIATRSSKP